MLIVIQLVSGDRNRKAGFLILKASIAATAMGHFQDAPPKSPHSNLASGLPTEPDVIYQLHLSSSRRGSDRPGDRNRKP